MNTNKIIEVDENENIEIVNAYLQLAHAILK